MLNSFGNITNFYNSQSWIPMLPPVLPQLLGLQEVGRTWQLPTGFEVMDLTDSSAGTAETREPASEGRRTGVAPVSASVEEHRTSFCLTVEPTSWSWSPASALVVLELCSISLRCTPTSTAVSCGGGVGPPRSSGGVTVEPPLVTSRTRRTLCWCAETSSPAARGSRCEGQNTWEKTARVTNNQFHFILQINKSHLEDPGSVRSTFKE